MTFIERHHRERIVLVGVAMPPSSVDEAASVAIRRTVALARRQRVWFRRDPRITWLAAAANPVALLPALLGNWSQR